MRLSQLIAFFVLLTISQSLQNYQQRIVYYNESENACAKSDDIIILKINLSDVGWTSLLNVSGRTWCSPSAEILRYASTISLPETFSKNTTDQQVDILFSQSSKKVFSFGLLHRYIANVTITRPIKYGGLFYDCEIAGDGKEQHFDAWPGQPAATITLNCNRQTNIKKIE